MVFKKKKTCSEHCKVRQLNTRARSRPQEIEV